MRSLILILFFPTLVLAEDYSLDGKKEEKLNIECKVTYPTPDTAVKDGITYKLQKSSGIYQKIVNENEVEIVSINDSDKAKMLIGKEKKK